MCFVLPSPALCQEQYEVGVNPSFLLTLGQAGVLFRCVLTCFIPNFFYTGLQVHVAFKFTVYGMFDVGYFKKNNNIAGYFVYFF